jgi:hypothetical protein
MQLCLARILLEKGWKQGELGGTERREQRSKSPQVVEGFDFA